MREYMSISKTAFREGRRFIGVGGSLFSGLTFISLVTVTLCLLFGKLLGTFFSGGDTGDDVAKRVI